MTPAQNRVLTISIGRSVFVGVKKQPIKFMSIQKQIWELKKRERERENIERSLCLKLQLGILEQPLSTNDVCILNFDQFARMITKIPPCNKSSFIHTATTNSYCTYITMFIS
ncbi:taurine import ATP-binding protein TauB [Striga asiatica]|uniref:Taurine import ATP-binding protein TauB n=1 Tax=Striga asiatica TaxID=4170 RepID=A0A5A7QEV3_STRAF|nr:taurine import ATP-binding protein TauB [Striga asiatica]